MKYRFGWLFVTGAMVACSRGGQSGDDGTFTEPDVFDDADDLDADDDAFEPEPAVADDSDDDFSDDDVVAAEPEPSGDDVPGDDDAADDEDVESEPQPEPEAPEPDVSGDAGQQTPSDDAGVSALDDAGTASCSSTSIDDDAGAADAGDGAPRCRSLGPGDEGTSRFVCVCSGGNRTVAAASCEEALASCAADAG